MLVKFLEHGTGSARKAANYLLGEKDHAGNMRSEVRVLRGDPNIVAEVADALEFKNRYTSGVLAFAPEDKPTNEQINSLLDDFERLSFSGLGAERVAYSAILHGEADGGCHIHIFAARVDLATAKSFNLAPPGWEKSFGALKDYYNALNGWADPDDPSRARNLQPGKLALIEASALRRGLEIEPDSKRIITDYLEQRILAGLVKTRSDVIDALCDPDIGLEITRRGRDYISVKHSNGQKIRLKGALYEEHFDITKPIEPKNRRGQSSDSSPEPRSLEELHRELEDGIRRRAEYNKKYYAKKEPGVQPRFGKSLLKIEDSNVEDNLVDVNSSRIDIFDLPSHDSCDLVLSANGTSSSENRISSIDRWAEDDSDLQHARRAMLIREAEFALRRFHSMIERSILIREENLIFWNIEGRKKLALVDNGNSISMVGKTTDAKIKLLVASAIEKKWTGMKFFGDREFQLAAAKEAMKAGFSRIKGSEIKDKDLEKIKKELDDERRKREAKKIHNERNRNATVGAVREIRRKRRKSQQDFDGTIEGNKYAIVGIEESSRSLNESRERLVKRNQDEIQNFKTKLSIAQVAQAHGYVLDPGSTPSAIIMRSKTGQIVIKKGADGVETFARSPGAGAAAGQGPAPGVAGGTIIDFLQHQESLNLGQIRRRLRPLLHEPAFDLQDELTRIKPEPPTPVTGDQKITQKEQEEETARMVAKLQNTVYQRAMKAIHDGEPQELQKPKT